MFGCDSLATLIASRSNRASAAGIRREAGREDLDGDVAIEPRIARAIDLAHPACAELARISYAPRSVPIMQGYHNRLSRGQVGLVGVRG